MDKIKVEVFIAAAELGTFTKVAEKLGYTQSGITHMMNALETEIGFPILTRGRHGVRPTPEGARLLPYFKDILRAQIKIDQEIELIKENKKALIKIGAYSSVAKNWLQDIIKEFKKVNPDIDFEILVGGGENIYRWLENYEIDIGFVSAPDDFEGVFLPLLKDPFMAVVSKDKHFKGQIFTAKDIENNPFIMPAFGMEKDIDRLVKSLKIKLDVKASAVDDSAVLAMVSYGMGITVFAKLAIKSLPENVEVFPIETQPYRTLGIAMRKETEQNPLIKEFVTVASKTAKNK